MRVSLFTILLLISAISIAQKIDFRNDSLFINSYYIDGFTKKLTLDSLLNKKGKEKRNKGKVLPGVNEKAGSISYIYKSKGIIFYRKDADTTKLGIGIKLQRNANPTVDQNNFPTSAFKGQFFIGNNYMNDKKTIEQLKQLKDCTFTFYQPVDGRIVYKKRNISTLFDFMENELTCIFIE
ncbi:MAG: hypothetical protein EAZ12_01715 [Sphingobacteriia bacterium]|nr:MAG: hypothetical protein EAZ12_01715 [Sphingobacteriia bacterium]